MVFYAEEVYHQNVRSYPDSSLNRFSKQFSPGRLSQQHSKENTLSCSILNHANSLNECPKLYPETRFAVQVRSNRTRLAYF